MDNSVKESKQEMYHHIRGWKESGQRQMDYCSSQGVAVSKFRYWWSVWLKEHSSEPFSTGHFYPVEATPQEMLPSRDAAPVEITISYPNGVSLQLNGIGIDPVRMELLAKLIQLPLHSSHS